ncbi:MAG: hypothetical protein ACXW2L_00925 [Burkholderiales bacterium]
MNPEEKSVVDQRRTWSFVVTESGKWMWKVVHPDGAEESSIGFATLKDCTDDAHRHGYVAWKIEDERRRDRELKVAKALRRR